MQMLHLHYNLLILDRTRTVDQKENSKAVSRIRNKSNISAGKRKARRFKEVLANDAKESKELRRDKE